MVRKDNSRSNSVVVFGCGRHETNCIFSKKNCLL